METKNIDEWLNFIKSEKNQDDLKSIGAFLNLDYEIVANAEAYALSPVVLYRDKMIAMEYIRGENLEDIKNKLNGKKYILYMPLVNFKLEKTENIELLYGVRCSILD
jgi:predicted Ser/Thr protein kinase